MKKYIFLAVVLSLALPSVSQVPTILFPKHDAMEKIPIFQKMKKRYAEKQKVNLPEFDVTAMIKEDNELIAQDVPYRFGKAFDVHYNLDDGKWRNVEDGRIWIMTFESKGAFSINLVIEDLHLPDSAYLYIVNKDETILYGPITNEVVAEDGFYLTGIIGGQNISLLLYEPDNHEGETSFTITRVVHGYRQLSLEDNLGWSLPCNHDVVEFFPDYENDADAVAVVLLSTGDALCSGSLLMSSDSLYKPYFLTAFHCINVEANNDTILSNSEIYAATHWSFVFQYRKESINSNNILSGYTYSQAYFRAAWNHTDFALMELKSDLKKNQNLYWLGWDRTGSTPSSGACIHHPQGDIMKISLDYDSFNTCSWENSINSHWKLGFDIGIVEHGSSGSPLLDQNHRVVGQLHGCTSQLLLPCNNNGVFGKFNLSWQGGGTSDSRLSDWLDPNCENTFTMNGSRSDYIEREIIGSGIICGTQTYKVNNLPVGYRVDWSIEHDVEDCLEILVAEGDSCIVQNSGNLNEMYSLIKATIWHGNHIVSTSTKKVVAHGPLSVTVTYDTGSSYDHTIEFTDSMEAVMANAYMTLKLESNNFENMIISTSNNAPQWTNIGTSEWPIIHVDLPLRTSPYEFHFYGTSTAGNCFDFDIPISVVDETVIMEESNRLVVTNNSGILSMNLLYDLYYSFPGQQPVYGNPWSVTVKRLFTGVTKFTGNALLGQSITANTSSWPNDIYVVEARAEGLTYRKKIYINN